MYISTMKFRNLLWVVVFLVCSCGKNQPAPVGYVPFSFSANYDSFITCTANSSKIMFFNVKVLSGIIDTCPVTFAISNLPPNVTVIPTSQTFTLELGGIFTFNIGNLPPGVDTMTLTISSKTTGSQNHKILLTVNTPTDYSRKLAGTYPASYDYCTPVDSIFRYTATASTVADTPYELKIRNIKNLGAGFIVTAWISTNVTIPYQTIGAYQIWGSGTYTHDSPPHDTAYEMIVYDTLVSGLDTEHCIIHLQH